jgi:ribonuclease HI
MPLYKKELEKKGLELKEELSKNEIDLLFTDGNYRDYSLSMSIEKNRTVIDLITLYYKPTKKSYTLKEKLLDIDIKALLLKAWDKVNNFETYDSQSGIYEAFVDGTCINEVTAYASIIYLGDKIVKELAGIVTGKTLRQISGELQSVIETLNWCIENNVGKIRINYDYIGIEKFAIGGWKPNNEITQKYVEFINKTPVQIEWRKINSHTGNKKNDLADNLAKQAVNKYTKTKAFTDKN